jgi:hypothetical protein
MNLIFNLNLIKKFDNQFENSTKSTIFHVKYAETEYICAYYGGFNYLKFIKDSAFTRVLIYKRLV